MPAELLPAPEPARPRFRPGARSSSAGRVPHAASPRTFRRMPHAFPPPAPIRKMSSAPPSSPCPKVHRKRRKGLASPAPPPSGLRRAVRMPDGAPRRGHDATPLPSRKIPRMSGGRLRDEPVCTNLFRTPPSDDSGRSPLRTDKAPSPSAPPVRRLDGNLRARRGPSPPRLQEQRSSAGPCRSLFRRPSVEICPHRRRFRNFCIIFAFGFHANSGLTGFDSRQSLSVSTPSAVWRLVNPDAQHSNGNNSYALAA